MATRGDGDGPGRGDLNRVSADVSARLEARGIVLDGRESAEDIVAAVRRWRDRAVDAWRPDRVLAGAKRRRAHPAPAVG